MFVQFVLAYGFWAGIRLCKKIFWDKLDTHEFSMCIMRNPILTCMVTLHAGHSCRGYRLSGGEPCWTSWIWYLGATWFGTRLAGSLHLRLELVWSILLYRSFEKGFIWGWSWFEASCFTAPLRNQSLKAGAGLKHLPLHALWEKLHLRLELVWSILLYRSFKKSFIWGWSWFESFSFVNPSRNSSFEAEAGLDHLPLQIL